MAAISFCGESRQFFSRYDEQHEIFVKTTTDLKALKAQCEQAIKCMEMFVEQNVQVSNKFQDLCQGAQFSSVSSVRTKKIAQNDLFSHCFKLRHVCNRR
jgi:hypothetical protein